MSEPGPGDEARVRRLIAGEPGIVTGAGRSHWLQRMCAVAARTVPAIGAGVSLMNRDGSPGLTAASDSAALVIEELQFTLGEGPCVDAYATRAPVLAGDLADWTTQRWPAYGPAARDFGVEAVFAFPLQVGGACLGVLDVYRDEPGMLSATSIVQATTFARVALVKLLEDHDSLATGLMGDGSEDDPALYRLEVHQAAGMVMAMLGVGAEEAMLRIRAHAFAEDQRISAVATDIISRRLVFEKDHE